MFISKYKCMIVYVQVHDAEPLFDICEKELKYFNIYMTLCKTFDICKIQTVEYLRNRSAVAVNC